MTSNHYTSLMMELASLFEHVEDDGDKKLVEFIYEYAKPRLKMILEMPTGNPDIKQLADTIMKRVANTVKQAGGDEMANLKTALSQALNTYVRVTGDEVAARSLMGSAISSGRRPTLAATAIVMIASTMAKNNKAEAMAMVKQVAQRLATDPQSLATGDAVWKPEEANNKRVFGKTSPKHAEYAKSRHGIMAAHEGRITEALDPEKAREIAMNWHLGLESALYTFGTTGKIWNVEHKEKLIREIRHCMEHAQKKDASEARKLQNLLAFVTPMMPPESGVAETMTAGAIATTAMPLGAKPKKKVKVKEDRTVFDVSVAYDIVTPESAQIGDSAERGFEIENQRCDLAELIRIAENYGILPRRRGDLTQWWESEPEQNFRTGAEKTYSLHVKINGKRLDQNQFDRLNGVISRVMRVPVDATKHTAV